MRIRSLVIGVIITLSVFLSSCRANWFDRQIDVAWWMIAISVFLFLVTVWVVAGKCISKKRYACKKCKKSFFPAWWSAAMSLHMNEERVFKCPHCGTRGFCSVSSEEE